MPNSPYETEREKKDCVGFDHNSKCLEWRSIVTWESTFELSRKEGLHIGICLELYQFHVDFIGHIEEEGFVERRNRSGACVKPTWICIHNGHYASMVCWHDVT